MLEALGNLGDFIGGIAVVVTLLYLAVQVRQNTTQLRESSTLARVGARSSVMPTSPISTRGACGIWAP